MARTGKFGRQPRVAASLTNTLVSIAKQFQDQIDSDIMSAWQKGGTYQGQPVTDAMVLQHWNDRMAGVSKQDPMYDNYKESVQQLTYSIAESKMTASYALQKTTDAQMVSFFLGQLKGVPVNSEFYRVLQRDAGQYMRKATAVAKLSAAQIKENAYQAQVAAMQAKNEAPGQFLFDSMRRMAQSGNASMGIGNLIAGPGSTSDLTDFDSTDPASMLRLLNAITPPAGLEGNLHGKPSSTVLYHNDMGQPVTGATLYAQFQKLVPGFTGPLNLNTVNTWALNQMHGIQARIAIAQKTAHFTDVANWTKSLAYVAELHRETQSYPVEQTYLALRQIYQSAINPAGHPTPMAIVKAWQSYSSSLLNLANDPRIAADDNFKSRIAGEANGTAGTTTIAESFTGLTAGGASNEAAAAATGDVATNTARLAGYQAMIDAVNAGQAVWTTGKYDANGVFTAQPGGQEIGTTSDPQSVGLNPVSTMMSDPSGAGTIPVVLTGVSLTGTSTGPDGTPDSQTDKNPIATVYSYPDGSPPVYAFPIGGQRYFSSDAPVDPSIHISSDSTGYHVDLGAARPDATKINMGVNGPVAGALGWQVVGASANGATPGHLELSPGAVALASDRARNAAGGPDPMTDFFSSTLAHYNSTPALKLQLATLATNPDFQKELSNEAQQFAGGQWDAKQGWTGADPTKLSSATMQISDTNFMATGGIPGLLKVAVQRWQRANTDNTFVSAQTTAGAATSFGGGHANITTAGGYFTPKPLATDVIRADPTANHQALANAFTAGTNKINTNPASQMATNPTYQIKSPVALTVPLWTPPTIAATKGTPGSTAGTKAYSPPAYSPPSTAQTGGGALAYGPPGSSSPGKGPKPV